MVDFAELVTTESQGLIAATTVIVGDRHRAEEVVQVAFERCFRRWSRVSRLDKPGAWTRRVAINEAISVARKSSSEQRAVDRLEAMASTGSGEVDDPLAGLDDDGIWAAVRALPQDQAAAIALRYGADLAIAEIADTLQVTVPAAKSLLHRARSTLRSSPTIQSHAEGAELP